VRAPAVQVSEGGEVSAQSAAGMEGIREILARSLFEDVLETVTGPPDEVSGRAGAIEFFSDSLELSGGRIAASAENADGGNISIQASRLLDLDRGWITASVTDGIGGNISIDSQLVMLRDGSQIVATAGAGIGGRIQITADRFFAFPGSGLSADAGDPQLSGTVEIHSPDANLAGTLTALPVSFLDAPSLLHARCSARVNSAPSGSFVVRGPGGIPAEPDGWLRAPSLPDDAAMTVEEADRPTQGFRYTDPRLVSASCW